MNKNTLSKMGIGETWDTPLRKGWRIMFTKTEDGFDVKIYCPTEDRKGEMFFTVDTSGNPYGAPKIIQEPTLGISCKEAGVEIDGNIVGALIVGESGKIEDRFSWSNLVFTKNLGIYISEKGKLIIETKSQGYLSLLFLPDKNRIEGYVGVFTPEKPEKVKVIELEDLLLSQLSK